MFSVFRTIWVHLGPLCCHMKLGAEQAKLEQLMQKFVPRRRVGNFHNERTRSTPLDPKMMFWCVLYHLGAFGTVWLPYETRCKTAEPVQKFVPRCRVGIFCNERTRSTPLDPKLMFCCILCHLGAFATIQLPYETRFKSVQTGAINAKVRAMKSCRDFSQRTHPIHPIGP